MTLRGERDITGLSFLCRGLLSTVDDAEFSHPVVRLVEDEVGNQHQC
ncbi:MAG: hypothetical protein HKN26_16660 [Acidimicrobiales bacterium]|nr:hypothetical protein [Acidimicrobiales bacterium]